MRGAAGQLTIDDAMLHPGYQPEKGSDEEGLWHMMDRAENNLRQSRFVVRDQQLNEMIGEMICRLGKDYCPDIRAYVVRTPYFNASMAPNGMMQIWTGLLLRCSDEAQLAAIVGHEMGHYIHRHSIQRFRDVRNKAGLNAFLALGLAAAGQGWAGGLTDLALTASIFSFSREQEREADTVGLEIMARAGYTPVAAHEVWEQLIAEAEVSTADRTQSVMFASHPAPEERLVALREQAERLDGERGERGYGRFRESLAGVRQQIVDDELSLRQYGRSEVVFERLIAQSPNDGLLWYAKGEVYRLRAEPGDWELALKAYETALSTGCAPPETYRSIVLVELKQGNKAKARKTLELYMEKYPEAGDADSLQMLFY
jgi:predicted Zn-dependent protease